jgi:SAM-dependent methyltransferase
MRLEIYRCTNCFGDLVRRNMEARCSGCGSQFKIENDRLLLFVDPPLEISSSGFASKLFDSPLLYKWFVALKRLVAPDAPIGLKELSKGASLLNVGCGSSVSEPHLEYELGKLKFLAGTDISLSFVRAASKECDNSESEFCVSSAVNLPYKDMSFDIVLLPFVLHHMPFSFKSVIREAHRVAKEYVVIFDHIKATKTSFWRSVQEVYWRVMDGGSQYLDQAEWDQELIGFDVVCSSRTGAIGKHVLKIVLKK